MKIAFTFQNSREITGHAGKTSRFLVYTLNDDDRVIKKDLVKLDKEDILHNRFHNSANPYAPHPIFEVDLLITGGAGAGFVKRLASQAVQVMITTEIDPERALQLLNDGKLPLRAPHIHSHH